MAHSGLCPCNFCPFCPCYLEFLSVSFLGSCERIVLVLAYKLAFMVYVTWDQSYSRGVQSSNVFAPEGILQANKWQNLDLGRMSLFSDKDVCSI